MGLFELRYGDVDAGWKAWRNEQVEMIPVDTCEVIGKVVFRADPLPYCSQQELIEVPGVREPIDLLSQGV